MALPRINETLNFTMTIPSSGEKVKYRPYLVKEEKVLLQAFESKDSKTCLEAMVDTIGACLDERAGIDVAKLATFDVEYMFTQLRAKSVGEISTILLGCSSCEERNEYDVNLETLEVEVERGNNIIQVTDAIKVEMRYPTYDTLLNGSALDAGEDMGAALSVVASSIAAVHTEEERIDAETQLPSEMEDFVASMTAAQLQSLTDFLASMPALKHKAEFMCVKCGTANELELSGLSDFF
jgi:hypothetical protein